MLHNQDFDVVVIGGGPGGSATAGLLAQQGHNVLVLEKEKFPRYHIGESLITGSMPTIEALGLRDRLDKMGYVRKYGGTLMWGRNQGAWDFRFTEASEYEYTFQVRRADFDSVLMARARELGALVIEEAAVQDVLFEGERAVGVRFQRKGDAEVTTVNSKLVVDASGQQHLLARKLDLIEYHQDLRNIAVWAYFQNCNRYSGTRWGDTLTENRPKGWFWFIPLSDSTVSIGYVTPIDEYKKTGRSLEELHASELAAADEITSLVGPATRVSGYRTIKDWSYTCKKFYGPGWALVGDAAAFIDPLLSTGVGLTLRGALGLSETAHLALSDPDQEVALYERYETNYREFLGSLLEFIRFFYDRTKSKEDYWDAAQQAIDLRRLRPRKIDFARMLSGVSGMRDIFDGPLALKAFRDSDTQDLLDTRAG
ncbi:NAD(P)/FAD-dependent oxidoreductase [Plantactinospora soyae]|uniref:Flavin-dependent dehydrogenase n=1 Tax=Plantactinospora soyae TaxID=1544732 RepID=A0A927R7R8_9ACTN|nr:NAD(P)/FAD-dependent oxidoreductase [Plantactinospora soyae]MBE1489734.1 flavin-dependent dehydrogenase [Plantactinospora soyae]